jgi:hypothetical protein
LKAFSSVDDAASSLKNFDLAQLGAVEKFFKDSEGFGAARRPGGKNKNGGDARRTIRGHRRPWISKRPRHRRSRSPVSPSSSAGSKSRKEKRPGLRPR